MKSKSHGKVLLKISLFISVFMFFNQASGQVKNLGTKLDPQYLISYKSFPLQNNGSIQALEGYAAVVEKDKQGMFKIAINTSGDYANGKTIQSDVFAVFEHNRNPVMVTLDLTNRRFNFYAANVKIEPANISHSNETLDFIGNDGRAYRISFFEFVRM